MKMILLRLYHVKKVGVFIPAFLMILYLEGDSGGNQVILEKPPEKVIYLSINPSVYISINFTFYSMPRRPFWKNHLKSLYLSAYPSVSIVLPIC